MIRKSSVNKSSGLAAIDSLGEGAMGQRRSTTQNQGRANLIKTQVKYVDIRNKTIYTMINLTNHISNDYRDCQTTLNQVMD